MSSQKTRTISGYPDYNIDELGNVFYKDSVKPKEHLYVKSSDTYYVLLNNPRTMESEEAVVLVSVARLVARTFVPNPDNHLEIHFKDGDRSNFIASNLEWTSKSIKPLPKVVKKAICQSPRHIPDSTLEAMLTKYLNNKKISLTKLSKEFDVGRDSMSRKMREYAYRTGRLEEFEKRSNRVISVDKLTEKPKKFINHPSGLKIIQRTLDGEFVARHPSIRAAGKAIGRPKNTTIGKALSSKSKQAYGYIWEVDSDQS